MTGQTFSLKSHVPLAPLTTIGLGGAARYFASCPTLDAVREGLLYARNNHLRIHVLGGGSNTVFSDSGFDGLVLKIDLRGVTRQDHGQSAQVRVASGEPWDPLVEQCVNEGLGGIECLAGIPGSAGATPIQNVGAYGQEISDTILSVRTLDRTTLEEVTFSKEECRFGYRMSRFKTDDADRYIVLDVTLTLGKESPPTLRYPELMRMIDSSVDLTSLPPGKPALAAVRSAVLTLRRRKSMVIDPADPNSRSVGSFFVNPVLSGEDYETIRQRWAAMGGNEPVPVFISGSHRKIPAAWLVEHAGFAKGLKRGGAGVSDNHSLALVNRGGTTSELLALAEEIQTAVAAKFGVRLQREPVVVP